MIYLALIPVFFVSFYLYFRLAEYHNIVDRPNERSSHSELTIRGGGVIYLIAAIVAGILQPEFWMVVFALIVVGVISFIDDRITLSSKLRILFHLFAVSLVFYSLGVYLLLPVWGILLLYIVVIGIINAYNFMDGINGITGTYSLVVLGSLQFVNFYVYRFIEPDLIWLPTLASAIFLFYNFRTKAKCFAGDVGSITMALWIIFLLLTLIFKTGNYEYIFFLTVYGIDTVLTITHRLMLRQNIFDAHRLHFYQILANEQQISHLVVASIYSLVQLFIILIVIFSGLDFLKLFLITALPLTLLYIFLKPRLMHGSQKFKKN